MQPLIETGVSLRPFNSFGVEARARHFARIRSVDELARVLADPDLARLPRLVLGGGSNLLLTGDFDGLVLKIDLLGRHEEPASDTHWRVRVGAGENWHATVEALLAADRPGLENLALIPGSVGAAPIQNIGAYGLELAERFDSLTAWDVAQQREVRMDLTDCAFGYRDSVFKSALAGQRIVLDVTFALPRDWQPVTGYAEVASELKSRGSSSPQPCDVFNAVVAIRRRKLPDPAQIGNAGSFFKNPIVSREQRTDLIARFPSLVSYPLAGGRFKLAAGWLIEAAGMKGLTRGRAGVYEKQALVLVNRGGATGAESLALAREVQDKVAEKFGVRLEPEPVVL
ncbi:MAG: UDP-N-acetylmuramate dehydrogenase [Betaproteobacteria bacterium]